MVKPGGITPITDRGRPLAVIDRPSTSDRPPSRVCQNSWLMTITASVPLRSSSGLNARPSAGCTPSAGNTSDETA